jgi:GTPase SAR1 family protein
LWDLAGEPELTAQHDEHLRDATGYLLVADGTDPATLTFALAAHQRAQVATSGAPARLLLNKCDKRDDWRIGPDELARIEATGLPVFETSAVTGYGIESAFLSLAEAVVPAGSSPA